MDGIILIDKELGITSRHVVDKISRIIGTKKIGHTGTLDPMATGVLVLCVNKATKVIEFITNYDKEYIAEITLGIETDTLDMEGNIINEISEVNVTKDEVEEVLKSFIGKTKQQVPLYSAIKVNGKRLYKYARGNKKVELPIRDIEIFNIELINDLIKDNGKVKFSIKCHVSKGTYIRSLVRDIGLKLGYPAYMSSLRRTKQGQFKIEDCYKIEDIEKDKYKLISIDESLFSMPELIVDKELELKIKNGSVIDKCFAEDIIKIKNHQGALLAIYKTYEKDNTKAKPYKMLI